MIGRCASCADAAAPGPLLERSPDQPRHRTRRGAGPYRQPAPALEGLSYANFASDFLYNLLSLLASAVKAAGLHGWPDQLQRGLGVLRARTRLTRSCASPVCGRRTWRRPTHRFLTPHMDLNLRLPGFRILSAWTESAGSGRRVRAALAVSNRALSTAAHQPVVLRRSSQPAAGWLRVRRPAAVILRSQRPGRTTELTVKADQFRQAAPAHLLADLCTALPADARRSTSQASSKARSACSD
jgi:hypothetical protein